MPMRNILGVDKLTLERYCIEHGYRSFHGRQIFHWLYEKLEFSFGAMSDLPSALRTELEKDFTIGVPTPFETKVSREEDAWKYGFVLGSGLREDKADVRDREREPVAVEAVVLADRSKRVSFCVSSQAGCPVGCAFCATGRLGLVRNLSSDEILGELLALMKRHGKPDSVLFMGMGEPLLNADEVERAISFMYEIGISARRVTVSTCGIVKGIQRLAASGLRPRLSVSMGSAIEEKRLALIPAAAKNPLADLRRAIVEYHDKTGRRVSLEYTLLDGVNATEEDLEALAFFAKTTRSHVNLIRFNRVPGSSFRPPGREKVERFRSFLASQGIEVSERYRRGEDIQGACGQLAARLETDLRGTEPPETEPRAAEPERKQRAGSKPPRPPSPTVTARSSTRRKRPPRRRNYL